VQWLDAPEGVLFFRRPDGNEALLVVVNISETPIPLAQFGTKVLLASAPLPADGTLPRDTAVWLTA
jgi:alpha-glucosidase